MALNDLLDVLTTSNWLSETTLDVKDSNILYTQNR